MLAFRDMLAVAALAAFGEDPEDFIHDGGGGHGVTLPVSGERRERQSGYAGATVTERH
jgi:hypothetical protein